MQIIKYEFIDGTISKVLVNDTFYQIYQALLLIEIHNNKRETRRHISLDYLYSNGIDYPSTAPNPCAFLITQEHNRKIKQVLSKLTKKQKQLLYLVVFEKQSLRQIAKVNHITHQTLSRRLAHAYKKLKKFL